MRLVVVFLSLSIGCANRALPEDPNLAVGPLDLSASPRPDLSVEEPPDLGSPPADLALPQLGSCSFASGGGNGAPPPPVFDSTTVEAGAFVGSIGVGDLDGDGRLDLVTANRNDFEPPPAGDVETISVILSSGPGTFKTQVKYPAPLYPWNIGLGDFNHDGLLDVVADSGQTLGVRLNLGGGMLGASTEYADNTRGARALAVADVNRDGTLDLAWSRF